MALEIEEIRSLDRLVRTSEEWKEVLSTSGEDRLFLSLAWLKPWWECFGDRRELLVLQALEDGRAVGFAPFMVTARGRIAHWRKLEFIGSGPSDRCGIIAAEGRPDVHLAIWDHLRARDDWDVIELRDILAGGPTERSVRACHPSAEYAASISPHIMLKQDYPTYFAGLSRSMRSNLGRGWRRLEDEGVVLRTLEEWSRMGTFNLGSVEDKGITSVSEQMYENMAKGAKRRAVVDSYVKEFKKEPLTAPVRGLRFLFRKREERG